jgi:hypothetical protein
VTENLGSAMMPNLSLQMSCIRCSVLFSKSDSLLLSVLISRCIDLVFLLLSFLLSRLFLFLSLLLSGWLVDFRFSFEPSSFFGFLLL